MQYSMSHVTVLLLSQNSLKSNLSYLIFVGVHVQRCIDRQTDNQQQYNSC